MAKKSKNSKLLVHYARTMTPKNLSRAANYVGGYVLKGLGAFGKIMTAPFISQGPTSATIYKSKKLLAKERTIENKSEELLGKAMTWVSPLNYGAALATGNGLDARKGEEEVASWSPAWQAIGRLGELYVGPKAVKGVKATPKIAINTAAKAGVKPAKAAVVAREINLGIKLNTKNGRIEVTEDYFNSPDKWYRVTETPEKFGILELGRNVTTRDNSGTRGIVDSWRRSIIKNYEAEDGSHFKITPGNGSNEGYFVKTPDKHRFSLSKQGAAHGNTSQAAKGQIWGGTFAYSGRFPGGVLEGQAPTKIFRGMTETGKDSRTNFILQDWNDVPHGARVGFHTGEMPMSNLGWFQRTNKGTYTYEPIISEKRISYNPTLLKELSTSLKFFERKPSKISEAEKFGLNKHDRRALSVNEQLALEDLALYKNSGLYRLIFRVTPDWENFGWNLDRSNPSFLLLFVKDGESMRGPWARVVLQTPTGKGILAVNPERNMAGYTSRSFPVPEGMNWAPGEANMMIDGTNGLKVILTAPRTDFFDAIVEKGSESIGEKLPNTIDKSIMKDFWINSRKALRPGTYLSGDNGYAPKGSELIEAFKKRLLHKIDIKERPLNKQFVTRTGLSPDSYSSIIRQGNRDGSLRWGEGFNKWNNSAVENKFINEAFLKLLKGEITPEQYEDIFNNWSLNIGGRKLLWKDFNGHKIPIHPHPYIYAKKQGGKMNILEFLKNGSGIHIKKKNRGSFTRWCGGNVTSECILRGKNSSNPKIRRKATFAGNVRKWKHLEGGAIINESPIVAQRMLWLQNLSNLQQELERMLKLQLKQQEIDRFNSMFNTFSDIGLTLLDKYLTKKNASPQQTNSV